MMTFLQNPLVKGALAGLIAAAVVDVHAFLRWKNKDEAAAYDWRTMVLRWAQGAIGGFLTAAGLGAVA